MPIFELDEGRPLLVQPMQPASSTFAPDTSALVADHLTALLGEQLFQVRVRHDDDDAPHLLALDAGGQPVVVDVVHLLDAEALVRALGFAGAAARLTRSDLARAYQGGREAFDADHAVFRDRAPLSAQHAPRTGSRLVLVCSEVDDDVSDALAFLRQPGRQVEVLQMGVVQGGDGRRYVDVSPVQLGPHRTPRPVEPAAMIVPAPVPAPLTVTGASAHEAVGAVSRPVEVPREATRPAPVPTPRLPDDAFDVPASSVRAWTPGGPGDGAPVDVRADARPTAAGSTSTPAVDAPAAVGDPTGADAPPVDPAPVGAATASAAPAEVAPAEVARAEAAPAESGPVEAARAETARAETARAETARAEAGPVETARAEAAPFEAARAEAPPFEAAAPVAPAGLPEPGADRPATTPAPRPAPTAPADVEATMRMAPVPLDDDHEAPLEPPTRSGGFAPRPEEQRAAEQRAAEQRAAEQRAAARRRVDEITTYEVPRDADARAAELRAADEALARARAFDAARIRPARREPSPLTAPIFLPDRRADAPAPGAGADVRTTSGPVPAGSPAVGATPAPIPTPEPYRPTFLADESRVPAPATSASTRATNTGPTTTTGASSAFPTGVAPAPATDATSTFPTGASTTPQPTPARQHTERLEPAPAPLPSPAADERAAAPDAYPGGRRAAPATDEDPLPRDHGLADAPSRSAVDGSLRPATLTGVLPSVRPDPALAALAKGRGAVATLVWFRERRGQRLLATLRGDGLIELPGGRVHADPDEAAADAANAEGAVDGWGSWRVGDGGPTLAEAAGVR